MVGSDLNTEVEILPFFQPLRALVLPLDHRHHRGKGEQVSHQLTPVLRTVDQRSTRRSKPSVT